MQYLGLYTLFAPRMWRCFSSTGFPDHGLQVCSTHVEMFPAYAYLEFRLARLLHACGDVSVLVCGDDPCRAFAPRMWRCFSSYVHDYQICGVCSTHVEMFLPGAEHKRMESRLLHACGDVSKFMKIYSAVARFAPRMWRCFPGLIDHF